MKKIYLTILGISLISILSLGLNDSFKNQAVKNQAVNIGDGGGAPARPDYVLQTHADL
ncbi:Phr family secreted Rap phosphatase inhibitor [Bacillus mycoides]|uniref:Phr family secreted Rap phosphatase inhibitor n=1 Tax=Bacillus mycoides TaxID=1405 RepID=UPI003CFD6C86